MKFRPSPSRENSEATPDTSSTVIQISHKDAVNRKNSLGWRMSLNVEAASARPVLFRSNKNPVGARLKNAAMIAALGFGGVLTIVWSAGLCWLAIYAVSCAF